ncbi:MAG TPA: aminotransferase class V-fold PLP-dependent enzyme [Clostridia bacterium]|nr:aminotransferase class V-fold PLP-dependent enzyme [Clostridia bacterium]
MKAYPIQTMDLEKAKEMQFRLVDIIHRNFDGHEFLQGGDYGVVPGIGRPQYTGKVEAVLARFFNAEAAVLVRGAGTGAIRNVMNAVLKPNQDIIVHKAPIYPTTEVIIEAMGLKPVYVDFNRLSEINEGEISKIGFALLQHSRQKLDDSYELGEVIERLKGINKDIVILIDDNYVVMKAEKIGTQLGADISAFSLFKLLGPEGIGCVAGSRAVIERIKSLNYSGGGQVQGHEAMEALRALVYAPVALAIQAEEGNKIVDRLNSGEIEGIHTALIANAQSRVILVKFREPIAQKVLACAAKLGAAPYPVGAESRYEVAAMFYRVSGTFLKSDPELQDYMIRINPMRAGADTVIRVLREAVEKTVEEGRS